MFHKGARIADSDGFEQNIVSSIDALLDQFMDETARIVSERGLRRATVRSMLPCSLLIILSSDQWYVAAQREPGLPHTLYASRETEQISAHEVENLARWEFGFDEPFVVSFPASLLYLEPEQRRSAIQAIAQSHVEAELRRSHHLMNVIQVNPIFRYGVLRHRSPACIRAHAI